jgi:hypothetical protein
MSWPAKKTWSTVGVEPDGDDLAGEVAAGGDLLVADPDEAAG